MNIWNRFTMASSAAITTFKRTFSDPPGEAARHEFRQWSGHYDHLWALYTNDKFDDLRTWQRYKADYGLYRYIRSLYNPTRRLADFYGGIIYPGVLSEDGRNLPDGTRLAIPLAEDIPPELRSAIGQTWQWSNWQVYKNLMGRWGALLGNTFAEIVDDVAGGKIWYELVWPGLLAHLDVDSRGNVQAYRLEYDVADPDKGGPGGEYTYAKTVDRDWIRVYRNDTLETEEANPYGFVPAVWCPHFVSGDLHGSGAIRALGKFDEVNDQMSVLADKVRLINKSPVIAWGGGDASPLSDTAKAGSTADQSDPQAGREKLKILQGPAGGQMQTLTPEGIEETLHLVNFLVKEIENDHPELTMYRELRAMSQVTGPGAERMLGDAGAYIDEARANYDTHSRKLFQMAVAVGGFRANNGDWGRTLTSQQRKFLPFELGSYQRGDLNFDILPRPIVPRTPMEMIQFEQASLSLEMERSLMGGEGMTGTARAQEND